MTIIRRFFLTCVFVALVVGCATERIVDQYASEYIRLVKTETGYEIGEESVSFSDLTALPGLLAPYKSRKVIVGHSSEVTMGELLQLGPILKGAGYEVFTLDGTDTPEQTVFLGGG